MPVKKRRGRAPKGKPAVLPAGFLKPGHRVFSSMSQAAKILGIDREIIRQAKAQGCVAFTSGRQVREFELIEWLKVNGHKLETSESKQKDGKDLKQIELEEKIRKLQLANDKVEAKLVQVDWVRGWVQRVIAAADAILKQKLENEYPSVVAGLDPPAARVYGKRLYDSVMEELARLGDQVEAGK